MQNCRCRVSCNSQLKVLSMSGVPKGSGFGFRIAVFRVSGLIYYTFRV